MSDSRYFSVMILMPSVVLAMLYLDTRWLALLFGLVVCLAAWEWALMCGFYACVSVASYTVLICILLGWAYYLLDSAGAWFVILGAVFWWTVASFLVIAIHRQRLEMTQSRYYKALMGIIVLIPAWLSLVMLHHQGRDGISLLIFLCVLVWITDISAYFIGRRWGTRKLSPQISPGKSWAGVYGACASTLLYTLIYTLINGMQLVETILFITLCLATAMTSVIGDLTESVMKRAANIKDSGNLIPGHGGVLDRIDGLTAAGPVFVSGLMLTQFMP